MKGIKKYPNIFKNIDLKQRQKQTLARLTKAALLSSSLSLSSKNFKIFFFHDETHNDNTQDFSDSAMYPRYWENSFALVWDVSEPLGLSSALFQQLLKGFLQVPRCTFASQAHFSDILLRWSYFLYQSLCFPSWNSLTFWRQDFPVKKALSCLRKG